MKSYTQPTHEQRYQIYALMKAEHNQKRRNLKAKPRILTSTWRLVKRLLQEDWNHEQVSPQLKNDFNLWVSPEWIYHYIYKSKHNGGTLSQHLRCKKNEKNIMRLLQTRQNTASSLD